MIDRARLTPLLLALVTTLLLGAPALATPPATIEDPGAVVLPLSPNAACVLEPGPITPVSYVWNSPAHWLSVAWRIPRQSCAACASGVLDLRSVSFRVRWTDAPCSQNVTISVIAATGDPACPTPDPAQVLCGPVTYAISGTAAAGQTYTLPMPAGCCVFQDAFVWIQFDGMACGAAGGITSGLTYAGVPCVNCDQFVTVSGFYPTLTDWCAANPENPVHPIWIALDADCCDPTGSRPRSWGGIKTIYR